MFAKRLTFNPRSKATDIGYLLSLVADFGCWSQIRISGWRLWGFFGIHTIIRDEQNFTMNRSHQLATPNCPIGNSKYNLKARKLHYKFSNSPILNSNLLHGQRQPAER